MYTTGMSKCITAHNGLVGLYWHIHQTGYHPTGRINLCGVDVRIDAQIFMTFQNHGYLLQGCITGTFADTVDRNLYLTGSVEDTAERSEEHTSELQSPDHLVC